MYEPLALIANITASEITKQPGNYTFYLSDEERQSVALRNSQERDVFRKLQRAQSDPLLNSQASLL